MLFRKKDVPYGRMIFNSTMKNMPGFDSEHSLNNVINQDNISFKFPTPKDISRAAVACKLQAELVGKEPGLVVCDLYDHFHGFRVPEDEARYYIIIIGDFMF